MARRSLRPHLNQIRGWVRQGRTDAWIAHQLEVTVQQIEAFKKDNDLVPDEDGQSSLATTGIATGVDFDDEIDLRAEDDALIAAELEAAEAARAEEEARRAEEEARRAEEEEARRAAEEAEADAEDEDEDEEDEEDEDDEDDDEAPRKRRRGRRGGRGRRAKDAVAELEGTFDHGEEGYGLWLDPAVEDNPVYAEHWAGHRPVTVTIDEDQIVIRRAGDEDEDDD
jgi:TATA-binding protein-associated factor Taf7